MRPEMFEEKDCLSLCIEEEKCLGAHNQDTPIGDLCHT